ncbi:MAG: LPS assembly lipoprotein LptE [Pseudomonadota bacterium]
MQRRLWLTLMAATTAAMASGCGFELRKAPNFPFKTLFSPFSEGSTLGTELRRSLESGGNVRVITDSRLIDQADVILDVLNDVREKVVLSRNAAGLVREFQLRIRFSFRLRTPGGRELIPSSEIVQQRDISFNESAALAKESEEALLYREMQSDIVQQIMRRLAAVTDLQGSPRP